MQTAAALASARDEWWVIGSAAVLLHGGEPGRIADIDVILSARDLGELYEPLGLTDTPEPGKPMFRSRRFGRWCAPPLEVEFMAGLELRKGAGWEPVEVSTRVPVQTGDQMLFIPERAELIALLHRFGRPKALARAATLAPN